VEVAALARKRQIVDGIGAEVLPSDDVLDVVCEIAVFLMEKAILATVVRPHADKIARRGVHC
jgi:hypothetical protein